MRKLFWIKFVIVLIMVMRIFVGYTYEFKNDSLFRVQIKVDFELSRPGDTLILHFGPQHPYLQKVCDKYITKVNQSGIATFDFYQPYSHGYFSIEKVKRLNRSDYVVIANDLFWENGDDILLHINQPKDFEHRDYFYDTKITGINSEKYQTIYEIRRRYSRMLKESWKNNDKKVNKDSHLEFLFPYESTRINKLLSVLDSSSLDKKSFAYNVLKADIVYIDLESLRTKLAALYQHYNLSSGKKDSIRNKLYNSFIPIKKFGIENKAIAASTSFSKFYGELFKTIEMLGENYNELDVVKYITSNTNGILREAILCNYLDQIGISPASKSAYVLAQDYIQHDYYASMLKHIKGKNFINVNKYIFNDIKGNSVSLAAFNGKLVLIDVWFTGCGGCVRYRNEILSKIEKEFESDERFQILSISTDKDESVWKKSIALDTYTDPNGLNLYSGGSGMLHPFFQDLGINVAPTPILIDQEGNMIDNASFRLRDLNQLLDLINAEIK